MYKLNVEEYKRIGAPAQVIDRLTNGAKLLFDSEPEECFHHNRVFTDIHVKFIVNEINRLLSVGAIRESKIKPKCVLAMRAVPKKNNKHRLVIDCRHINSSMVKPSFSQEGITVVSQLIQEEDILMTIDVKDGFHHIPLHQESQSYVGIYWKGKFYAWCVLCFGIAVAPYLFHKVVRPVVEYLRQEQVRLAPFIDDFLLMMQKCRAIWESQFVLKTLKQLGWCPNLAKCDLSMTTQTVFVGFDINSNTSRGP